MRERGWPPPAQARFYAAPDRSLRWERHGEFLTWTLYDCEAELTPLQVLRKRLGKAVPDTTDQGEGRLHVALVMHVSPDPAPRAEGPEAEGIVCSELLEGKARISSTFRQGDDGFLRFHLQNCGIDEGATGAVVQRLLEIETYRSLAMLGLPLAERIAPELNAIEAQLPELVRGIDGSSGLEENRRLLDEISNNALLLERSSARSAFRFGATRAYHELVLRRLDAIQERPCPGYVGMWEYLSRRTNPAIRTCASIETRLERIGGRLQRASDVLRGHIELALEQQNKDLLGVTARRLALQLRLQETVEGLSVVAVSYYAVGLVHYLLEGLHRAYHWPDPTIGSAIAVPFVVVAAALMLRRVRNLHRKLDSGQARS